MPKYAEGQQVKIASSSRVEDAIVIKVGRTLVHVQVAGRMYDIRQYVMETGRDRGSYPGRIFTLDEWKQQQDRSELLKRLRQGFGVSIDWAKQDKLSNDTLRALLEVLDIGPETVE